MGWNTQTLLQCGQSCREVMHDSERCEIVSKPGHHTHRHAHTHYCSVDTAVEWWCMLVNAMKRSKKICPPPPPHTQTLDPADPCPDRSQCPSLCPPPPAQRYPQRYGHVYTQTITHTTTQHTHIHMHKHTRGLCKHWHWRSQVTLPHLKKKWHPCTVSPLLSFVCMLPAHALSPVWSLTCLPV